MIDSLIAGAISGYCSIAICYPLDNLRTRIQANSSSESLFKMIRSIYIKERMIGFYSGFSYPFFSQGLLKSVMFASFTSSKQFMVQLGYNVDKPGPLFVSGFCSGIITSVFISPIELIRNKLIVRNYNGLESAYTINLRGLIPTMWRDGPGVGLYFLAFSFGKSIFVRLVPDVRPDSIWVKLFSGSFAGVSYWCWALPFDTIKTIVQLDVKLGMLGVIAHLRRSGQLSRLVSAWPVALGRGVPGAAVTLTTYEIVSDYLKKST